MFGKIEEPVVPPATVSAPPKEKAIEKEPAAADDEAELVRTKEEEDLEIPAFIRKKMM